MGNYYDWQYIQEPRNLEKSSHSPSAFIFLLTTLLLTSLGLVMLYSASYNEALSFGLEHTYFFSRQLTFALLALVPIAVVLLLPTRWIRSLSSLFLLGTVALLLLTLFTSFGQTKLGSRRWLEIGSLPSIQPSEFAKIATALYFGAYFSKRQQQESQIGTFVVPSLVTLVITALILAGRDYSSALLFLAQCCLTLVAAGLKLRYLILLFAFIIPLATVAMFSQAYRIKRIVSFLVPTLDPSGINYQVSVSLRAIRRGGLFGVGLGNGVYKQGLLPEVHSDFIFASICEEVGFVGVALIILLFVLFIHLGYEGARRHWQEDRFISLTAFGLTTMIGLQAVMNLGVVTALLPPTGIPLPFFSQGGTSLMVVLVSCAFIGRCLLAKREVPR